MFMLNRADLWISWDFTGFHKFTASFFEGVTSSAIAAHYIEVLKPASDIARTQQREAG
jgi:hypothetical protein